MTSPDRRQSLHYAGATGDVGSLTEVAFYHRPTRTLLLTDAVVLVPPEPPAVVQRRDLLLAGGNPWYTAILYGIGDETKVCALIPTA